MIPANRRFFVYSLLFSYPLIAFSLDSDKNLPLQIVADEVTINHKIGLTTYQGHVKVTQGSTQLIADQLTTQTNKEEKLTEIIAKGKQAIYKTTPEENKPELIAKADTIKYYPLESKVILVGNAQANQEHNFFKAPQIEYNIKQQTIVTPHTKQGVTTITLQPKSEQALN